MRNAPASGIKPAASPATTGTQALKPAQSNAQPTTNTPAPAPVTPAAREQPAMKNIHPAIVYQDMSGMEAVVKKIVAENILIWLRRQDIIIVRIARIG